MLFVMLHIYKHNILKSEKEAIASVVINLRFIYLCNSFFFIDKTSYDLHLSNSGLNA